jgi:hypothetical protein
LNNSLEPFIGIWGVQHNGLTIHLFIERSTRSNKFYQEKDALILDYKITDQNNQILIDTRTANGSLSGTGMTLYPNGVYDLAYANEDQECEATYGGRYAFKKCF